MYILDTVFVLRSVFWIWQDGGSTTELHMAVSLYDVAVSIIKNLAADVKTWSSPPAASAAGRAVAALRGNNESAPPLTYVYM